MQIANISTDIHNIKRVTLSAPQPGAGNCRKLCIYQEHFEGNNSWIVINLYDFQEGIIEKVEYYDGGTP